MYVPHDKATFAFDVAMVVHHAPVATGILFAVLTNPSHEPRRYAPRLDEMVYFLQDREMGITSWHSTPPSWTEREYTNTPQIPTRLFTSEDGAIAIPLVEAPLFAVYVHTGSSRQNRETGERLAQQLFGDDLATHAGRLLDPVATVHERGELLGLRSPESDSSPLESAVTITSLRGLRLGETFGVDEAALRERIVANWTKFMSIDRVVDLNDAPQHLRGVHLGRSLEGF